MKAVVSSLAAFLAEGVKPRTLLSKAIILTLLIKLVVVVTMKVAFFSADALPPVDDKAMARLIGPTTQLPR
jgi:hypothetical protein